MRIRTVKPEFWRSEDIAALSIEDRLLFIGLWSYVDDSGIGVDRIAHICADLFAPDLEIDPPEVFARVTGGLQRLADRGMVVRYEAESRPFLYITNWKAHQRIDRPSKQRYPLPDMGKHGNPRTLHEDSASHPVNASPGTGEQRNRGTGEQGTEDQIKDLRTGSAVERVIDAEVIEDGPKTKAEPNRFEEFWTAYPRKVGKQKAVAKYKAAWNRSAQQEIIDGAHRLANDPNLPEQTFVPHATTWLERNGWEDEALPMRFRTSSDERLAVGMELAARAASRPKMINPFEN